MISGAAIFTAGDIAAQHISGVAPTLAATDATRVLGAFCLGGVWAGAVTPAVYGFAEAKFPGRGVKRVVLKMLVASSILSTFGNWATMFARRAIQALPGVDGARSLRECAASCNRDIGEVVRTDLKIWPLYDVLCFSLISPSWRPVVTALMSSAWATYMSIISARTAASAPAAEH